MRNKTTLLMTKLAFYISFIVLLIPFVSSAAEIYAPSQAPAGYKIPIAILSKENAKNSKISVSLYDKDKITAFSEFNLDTSGFGKTFLKSPDKPGKYELQIFIEKDSSITKKTLPIEIAKKDLIFLQAYQVRTPSGRFYTDKIRVKAKVIDFASKQAKTQEPILFEISDAKNQKLNKKLYTDKFGSCSFDIPAEPPYGKTLAITASSPHGEKTLSLKLKDCLADLKFYKLENKEILFQARFADGRPIAEQETEILIQTGGMQKILKRKTNSTGTYRFRLNASNASEENILISAKIDINGKELSAKTKIAPKSYEQKTTTDLKILSFNKEQAEIEINTDAAKNEAILCAESDGSAYDFFLAELDEGTGKTKITLENSEVETKIFIMPKNEDFEAVKIRLNGESQLNASRIKNSIKPGEPLNIEAKRGYGSISVAFSRENPEKENTDILFISDIQSGNDGTFSDSIILPFDNFSGYAAFYDNYGNLFSAQKLNISSKFSLDAPALKHNFFYEGDAITLPVTLTNYTKDEYTVNLTASERDSIDIDETKKTIIVKPYADETANYKISFKKPAGEIKLAIGAKVEGDYREIRESVCIRKKGYADETSSCFKLSDEPYKERSENKCDVEAEIYSSFEGLAQNAVKAHNAKKTLTGSELIGKKMLGTFLKNDIPLEEFSSIENTDGGFRDYTESEPALSSFILRIIAGRKDQEERFDRVKTYLKKEIEKTDGVRKALILYNMFMAGINIEEYSKDLEPNESDSAATRLFKSRITGKDPDIDFLRKKLSSFKDKSYFQEDGMLSGNISQRQKDIDGTAAAVSVMTEREVSELNPEGLENFLLSSRHSDGTWGNALRTWLALSALSNVKTKISGGTLNINVDGKYIKENIKEYEAIKKFYFNDVQNFEISSETNRNLYCFLKKTAYSKKLPAGMNKISMKFSNTKLKVGDTVTCSIEWDARAYPGYNFIIFEIPWGFSSPRQIYSKDAARQAKNDDEFTFLSPESGRIEIPLKAIYPGRISIKEAHIINADNPAVNGRSQSLSVEITEN